jgi:hypothetical protein
MKLTHELRNLEGRKLLHRDQRLKTACHEASHCLMTPTMVPNILRIVLGFMCHSFATSVTVKCSSSACGSGITAGGSG